MIGRFKIERYKFVRIPNLEFGLPFLTLICICNQEVFDNRFYPDFPVALNELNLIKL